VVRWLLLAALVLGLAAVLWVLPGSARRPGAQEATRDAGGPLLATSSAAPREPPSRAPAPPGPVAPRSAAAPPVAPPAALDDPVDPDAPAISDPRSTTVVVNKQRRLRPARYAPDDLRRVEGTDLRMRRAAARHLHGLLVAARRAHERLRVDSAYRSFATQRATYQGWVAELGRRGADEASARPGYSEHQTGLAADLLPAAGTCWSFDCFATTSEARWLAAHAYEHGFVVRYPKGARSVTGYRYEPWHVRYLGVATARRLHDASLAAGRPVTLEEYLGLPAAPGYRPAARS